MKDHSNFNDPNFDSRKFNPIRPKIDPGITFEEHQRIVAAGLKMIGNKPEDLPDIERLFRKAQGEISAVRTYASIIDKEVRTQGKDHNRAQLSEDIIAKFLDKFMDYSKEELLLVLAKYLTEAVVKEIV